ncbi:hypothetical protein [Sulfurospirillum barnesii]|uniref:Coiled coil domain-containing protein n=1 Tax=Sulfurospirillum barnesii (strain ATCC 700032 / DSM 10660 / SES-3) TaxID=760154 RepID=I3XWM6_SULBS|nr:hypothetical protein [Sulfurospirillum barnesii]AFL68350.1 hypothetical protein Sulba_1052 [Sulfurospirillum barnesii SES-3]
MSDKTVYEQHIKAHFDECSAKVDAFKEEASKANETAQIEMHKHIQYLEEKMSEGKAKLDQLVCASEEKFESMKKEVESIWQSTKSTLHHASKHFGK